MTSFALPDIFLKSFPVEPRELKDKLFIISEEDGGLSDEHITSLRRYEFMPKREEKLSEMLISSLWLNKTTLAGKMVQPIITLTRTVQLPLELELTGSMAMTLVRARWWLEQRGGHQWRGGHQRRGGRQLTCGAAVCFTALRLNSSFQNLLPEQLTNKRFIPGYLRRWKLLTRPRERTTVASKTPPGSKLQSEQWLMGRDLLRGGGGLMYCEGDFIYST